MAIARPTQGLTGLPTSFCEDWGRPITLAGAAGGRLRFPAAFRRDWAYGFRLVLGGIGQDEPAATSKLCATSFRAANAGFPCIEATLVGTRNLSNDVFFAGTKNLAPIYGSRPWLASTATAVGDRRTNDNRHYIAYAITGTGMTGTVAPTGNGTGPDHLQVDNEVTWRCIWNGSTHDEFVPDADWVAGPGRVVNGITLPEGFVPRLFRAFNIDRSRVEVRAYSNGGALADRLVRMFPEYFTHASIHCSTGPDATDPLFAVTPSREVNVQVAGATLDAVVGFNGPPSSVAIAPHPTNQQSLTNLATAMGQTGSLTNTGTTINYTTEAGNETELHTYPVPKVDARGNTIRLEWLRIVGAGHNISLQPDAFKRLNDFVDLNPRR